jgi:hypothetical protein
MVAPFPGAATFTLIHADKARQHPTTIAARFTIARFPFQRTRG